MSLTQELKIHYSKYNPETDYSEKWKDKYAYRRLVKRSIDSRHKQVHFVLRYELSDKPFTDSLIENTQYTPIDSQKTVHIIGAGPAGYFAALKCLEMGVKPFVFDRGKAVRERRRDLAKITKEHEVNPDSNYCFGEGGAGTYSDGKLYTRSKKRGSVRTVLSQLVEHGAKEDILIDAHPHIGTNKLPGIIENMRLNIEQRGGEIHFDSKLNDLKISNGKVEAIKINEDWNSVQKLIVATGHSARDIFELYHKHEVPIAFKPFAIGFRIEHPQLWVDQVQFHGIQSENLPPAAYSLVCQAGGKGVFSFCMCPGGIIAPCATSPGEVVTNGWSPSKRDNYYANSGMVTQVEEEDVDLKKHGVLAGIKLQQEIEKKAWEMAGKMQKAPAQMAKDYLDNKKGELRDTSYLPGLVAANLNHLFPKRINKALKNALLQFDKKMPGFIDKGQLIAPETRTSSPIKILRDKEKLNANGIENLYPCAEGAGYAGGIVSAAIDGRRCAEQACLSLV